MRKLRSRRALVAMVISALAAFYIYLVVIYDPMGAVLTLPSDDAFYYFKIAKNILEGNGCTFDGIAPTNGFHPMWMIILLFVFWLANQDPITPVLVIIAINSLLGIAILLLLYRLVDRYIAQGFGWIAVAGVLLPNVSIGITNGMETGLHIFVIILLLLACYKRHMLDPKSNNSTTLLFGTLLAIATLSRLDGAFLFISVICLTVIAMVVREIPPMRCLRRLTLLSAGFGITLLPYLIWNLSEFGHLIPISASVKSTFPTIQPLLHIKGERRFGAYMLAALLGLVILILVSSKTKDNWRQIISSPLSMLTLACMFHFANVVLFLVWGVHFWHWMLYGLTISIALAQFASQVTLSRRRLRQFTVAGLVIPMVTASAFLMLNPLKTKARKHEGWLRAAEWASANTPEDSVFGLVTAGFFGYFSNRRVINLDGKANSYEYHRYLMNGDVEGYMRKVNARYYARVGATRPHGSYFILIPRLKRPIVTIPMKEEWQIYRSPPIPDSNPLFGKYEESYFIIWEIPQALPSSSKYHHL